MRSSIATLDPFDVRALARAMELNTGAEGLNFALSAAQWELLAPYLQPFSVRAGEMVIQQGELDRTVFLLESGSLSVHYEDEKSRLRLAMVAAGSVVGERGFFSHAPRSASVQAAGPSVLWRLNAVRFGELSNRQPAIGLQLAMALASVLAARLRERPRRIAST